MSFFSTKVAKMGCDWTKINSIPEDRSKFESKLSIIELEHRWQSSEGPLMDKLKKGNKTICLTGLKKQQF